MTHRPALLDLAVAALLTACRDP
ncbi:MAG: hypothetical protein JWM10_2248, partial [Myxococcaceae bacterium]|nr:hypothetical protein [Myxococcaceae bacterium]